MNNLPLRLKVISDLVTKNNIADVGCDHGKLDEYLLHKNKDLNVIVSDISRPSLQKAIDLLNKNNYNFEYICCDGLSGYVGKNVEQCIISGMGGREIIKIIDSSPIEIGSYILSPQHDILDVKKFMLSRGYNIDFDVIILEKNKFYTIFRCEKSDTVPDFSEFDLLIGRDNFSHPYSAAEQFVKKEIDKVTHILKYSKTKDPKFEHYLNLLKDYDKRKYEL